MNTRWTQRFKFALGVVRFVSLSALLRVLRRTVRTETERAGADWNPALTRSACAEQKEPGRLPAGNGRLPARGQCYLHPVAAPHCRGSSPQCSGRGRTGRPALPAARDKTQDLIERYCTDGVCAIHREREPDSWSTLCNTLQAKTWFTLNSYYCYYKQVLCINNA